MPAKRKLKSWKIAYLPPSPPLQCWKQVLRDQAVSYRCGSFFIPLETPPPRAQLFNNVVWICVVHLRNTFRCSRPRFSWGDIVFNIEIGGEGGNRAEHPTSIHVWIRFTQSLPLGPLTKDSCMAQCILTADMKWGKRVNRIGTSCYLHGRVLTKTITRQLQDNYRTITGQTTGQLQDN